MAKRQAKRPKVDWSSRKPKNEGELERFVLDAYHLCSNFREDDPTTGKFKAAVAAKTDGFVLFCNAVVHAVLPNWRWFQVLVKTACKSKAFDPFALSRRPRPRPS